MAPQDDPRYKILIVDDVPTNIQVAANILKKKGYQMAFAQDAKTALAQVKANRFDLILLDVMMPVMDGFELCGLIRSDPACREVPIIFLTAKSDSESMVRGFELGAVDYVTKPFNGLELTARVETHLNLYRSKIEINEANRHLKSEIAERIKAEELLRRSEEKYRYLAVHDDLTGLYNTRYLYSSLQALIAGQDGDKPFSLIFMDMDDFKKVVDAHGHLNGSKALAEVAETIRQALSDAPAAYGAAYGGDEFVVVLPGFDKQQALQTAEAIRGKMRATTYLPAIGGVHLTASFGVSSFPGDADDIRGILAKADRAMFAVKTTGKNAVGGEGTDGGDHGR